MYEIRRGREGGKNGEREGRRELGRKEEDMEGRKEDKEWSYSLTITDVSYKTESDGILILGFWYLELLRE